MDTNIKTGGEIADELFVSRDATVCHPEIEEDVIRREKEQWIPLDDCLDIIEEVIVQCCTDESVKEASTLRLDSMALSSYADALRFLAKHGRVTIVSEYGRRVIASLNHIGCE